MGTRQEWGLLVLALLMAMAGFLNGQKTMTHATVPAHSRQLEGISGSDLLLLGRKMDINAAGDLDLQVLPRIGPVLAGRIIEYRNAKGPFDALDDLIEVKGIGQKTLAKIKPLLTVKIKK